MKEEETIKITPESFKDLNFTVNVNVCPTDPAELD